MLIFLLLVIIAVLLFGSSAVLGAISAVLGSIAAVIAVFFGIYAVASATGIDGADLMLYACFALLPLAITAGLMGVGKKKSPLVSHPGALGQVRGTRPETPPHVRSAIELDRKLAEEFRAKLKQRDVDGG